MHDDSRIALTGPAAARRVHALLEVGQLQRARQIASDAVAADPDSPEAHLALGRALAAANALEPALRATEQALRLAPRSDDALHLQGVILMRLARFASAERALRAAIAVDPSWPGYHATYARLLSLCDKNLEALEEVGRAIALDPDQPDLHTLRAELLLAIPVRHWDITESAARNALRMNPEDPSAHAVFGVVRMSAGDHAAAEEAFRTALALDPYDPLALKGLSELVKGKSPLYAPMLAWSQLLQRLGTDGALGLIFALWAVYAGLITLVPAEPEGLRSALSATYLALCAYTWFAEPVTRAILRRSYPWLE